MAKPPRTMLVNGLLWEKGVLDDGSGWWFELKGKFGELIVEKETRGSFVTLWWPPDIHHGEPVRVKTGSKTLSEAMRGGLAYIESLAQTLASTQVQGTPN